MRLLRLTDPARPAALPVVLGSLFWVGFSPILRGTAGSLVTALLAWLAMHTLNATPGGWWMAAAATAALAWIVANWALAAGHGRGDPSWFVLDEAAGLLLVLAILGAPRLADICLAFIAFRIYDMAKPWPVSTFESLPKGLGVLADDLAAAVLGAWTIGCLRWFMTVSPG